MSSVKTARRWLVAFVGGFAAIVTSLVVYWPAGVGVALVVGLCWLAMVQRRLSAADVGTEADDELFDTLWHLDDGRWQVHA